MPVHVAGTLDEARAAGLQHPNCRRNISAYLPSVTRAPAEHSQDPDGSGTGQRQHAVERSIRRWKNRSRRDGARGQEGRERQGPRLAGEDARAPGRAPRVPAPRHREQIGAGNLPPATAWTSFPDPPRQAHSHATRRKAHGRHRTRNGRTPCGHRVPAPARHAGRHDRARLPPQRRADLRHCGGSDQATARPATARSSGGGRQQRRSQRRRRRPGRHRRGRPGGTRTGDGTDWVDGRRGERAKENPPPLAAGQGPRGRHVRPGESRRGRQGEGRAAAATEHGAKLAGAEFRAAVAAAGLDLGEAAELIDVRRFVGDGGEVDADAIKTAVAKLQKIAPKTGTGRSGTSTAPAGPASQAPQRPAHSPRPSVAASARAADTPR